MIQTPFHNTTDLNLQYKNKNNKSYIYIMYSIIKTQVVWHQQTLGDSENRETGMPQSMRLQSWI